MSKQEELVSLLKEKNLKLSVAESFTGGLISEKIVSVSGASEVFYEGMVCYNAQSKIDRLNVKESTISEKGVVSAETAFEMATGLLKTGNCDLAIATTGYSDVNEDDKQIGLCYVAVGFEGKIAVSKNVFDGTRRRIMERASSKALDMAFKIVSGQDGRNVEEGQAEENLAELKKNALKFVIETNNASIVAIAKNFQIGFNRASLILEWMEENGYVSKDQDGKKIVVITMEEYDELYGITDVEIVKNDNLKETDSAFGVECNSDFSDGEEINSVENENETGENAIDNQKIESVDEEISQETEGASDSKESNENVSEENNEITALDAGDSSFQNENALNNEKLNEENN